LRSGKKEFQSLIKLSPLTLPLSPANGGEGGGEGEGKKEIPVRKFNFFILPFSIDDDKPKIREI
jgi:hypothetical protein